MLEDSIIQQLTPKEESGTAGTAPIQGILGGDELKNLRNHFKEEELCDLARVLGEKLPDSKWFVNGLLDQFFTPAAHPTPEEYKQAAIQRESQLITLFLVFSHGQGIFLGIHFYWGLMMGLSPEDLSRHVMLVGMYGGIQLLNAALTTLERTLNLLKRLAWSNNPIPGEVVREIEGGLGPPLNK
ncbi:hypothetical protein D187_006947 [Cystobacter fuscus DSM 2262]|uniref:Uncharacterized protein n=1 Tax=Cystobacter fuscus (strain ATCC 25194 / DSM 2262 / NBRC 100088 / M29) TaxID=1242864 RepID=S9QL49_CYSF2|nr:hypothetical protein [Cystobacter fuscus]EPX57193.1 hypothetical protein D187_006947 [Cystobacter fuscus DSM 2262]